MASKRKAKKQQKKSQAQKQPEVKKTAMKEAMEKAEKKNGKVSTPPTDEHKPAEQAVKKAEEEKKKVPLAKRVIIGYGSAKGGAIIHAITNRNNSVLCDTRRENYVVDPVILPTEVNCVKCLKYKQMADILASVESEEQPPSETSEPSESTEMKEKVEEVKEKAEEELEVSEFDTLKNLMEIKMRNFRKAIRKEVVKWCKEEFGKRPNWMIVHDGDGTFHIMHDPSRYLFFKNVKKDMAEELLVKLIAMPVQWDGSEKPPKVFIKEVKLIKTEIFQHFKQEEKEKPVKKRKKLKIKVEKPKKKVRKKLRIKRRSKI